MNQQPHSMPPADLPPLDAYEDSMPMADEASRPQSPQRPTGGGHAPAPQRGSGQNNKPAFDSRMKMSVYGTKNALSVTPSSTRHEWETVMIESAAKLDEQSKQYNWQKKTSIQITKQELPHFIMVMLGLINHCKFDSHGAANDKGFEIERQQKNLFFKTFARGALHPVPVPYEDAVMIGHLALSQYVKNFNGTITADVAMNSFRVLAKQQQR